MTEICPIYGEDLVREKRLKTTSSMNTQIASKNFFLSVGELDKRIATIGGDGLQGTS
jgi:uncharacterized small protein (DUF1192 family)